MGNVKATCGVRELRATNSNPHYRYNGMCDEEKLDEPTVVSDATISIRKRSGFPAMAMTLAGATSACRMCSCFASASYSDKMRPRSDVLAYVGLKHLAFSCAKSMQRRTFICAVKQDAEESFKKTVEVDMFIDTLRHANPSELQKLVVENILAFNETFWIRLAARSDTCKSEDDKKDYEELAASLMTLVDRVVQKTKDKIETATDVLKAILKPVGAEDEELTWPPKDPRALDLMEKEISLREQEGQLDEGFLSEVNAQLRQAKEDGDKPGLEAMLQKVLQLYAARALSKRSYAKKGKEVLKAEQLLETIIKAPEEAWNKLLIEGLTIGKGDVTPDELYAVINKRVERTLIRTEGGSYQQRVLSEYLKGIQSRAEAMVQVLQGNTP